MTSKNYIDIDNEGCIELRNAIIKQAASDWKRAKNTENRLKDKKRTTTEEQKYCQARFRIKEVESFFESDPAKDLCGNIDPMLILSRLKGGANDNERAT